ncbi:hypothetical protein ES703_73794 [subsurface metagenome]
MRVDKGKPNTIELNQFNRISVNNRDYYFRRYTGKFDGTGYVMRRPTIEEFVCYILGHTPELTHALSLLGRLKQSLRSIDWGCWL